MLFQDLIIAALMAVEFNSSISRSVLVGNDVWEIVSGNGKSLKIIKIYLFRASACICSLTIRYLMIY